MRQQRLLLGMLVIVTLAACLAVEPGWPAAYRDGVCAATEHLRAAAAQLGAAVAAIESADPDVLGIAAAGMEREARDASAALADAPEWGPGSQLLAELNDAASGLGRAAAAFQTGARQGIGPAVDQAVAIARDADDALQRAELEAQRLEDEGSWAPC
jgi:hypothetical protein